MALFAKFDGFDGESKDKGHAKWCDVIRVSWGAHVPGSGETGQNRRRGSAQIHDIQLTKVVDKASPKLLLHMFGGEKKKAVIPKVEIHNTATYGDGARTTYMMWELKNVKLSVCDGSADTSDASVPTETYSMNFEELKYTYVEFDSAGGKVGNVDMTWKVEEGEA